MDDDPDGRSVEAYLCRDASSRSFLLSARRTAAAFDSAARLQVASASSGSAQERLYSIPTVCCARTGNCRTNSSHERNCCRDLLCRERLCGCEMGRVEACFRSGLGRDWRRVVRALCPNEAVPASIPESTQRLLLAAGILIPQSPYRRAADESQTAGRDDRQGISAFLRERLRAAWRT